MGSRELRPSANCKVSSPQHLHAVAAASAGITASSAAPRYQTKAQATSTATSERTAATTSAATAAVGAITTTTTAAATTTTTSANDNHVSAEASRPAYNATIHAQRIPWRCSTPCNGTLRGSHLARKQTAVSWQLRQGVGRSSRVRFCVPQAQGNVDRVLAQRRFLCVCNLTISYRHTDRRNSVTHSRPRRCVAAR